LDWGSYTGTGTGGSVYNARTGARNNGDGAITFRAVGGDWWAYMFVQWHTSNGYVQREVGTWLA
jgi:hypothetical protein